MVQWHPKVDMRTKMSWNKLSVQQTQPVKLVERSHALRKRQAKRKFNWKVNDLSQGVSNQIRQLQCSNTQQKEAHTAW